jgi:DNA-binding response OmpR family regulator
MDVRQPTRNHPNHPPTRVWYGGSAVARLVLLSDRTPSQVLPALSELGADVKVEALSPASIPYLEDLGAEAILVDAADNPPHAHTVLLALAESGTAGMAVLVVTERDALEQRPWHEVVDDVVYPGAPEAEIRLRLAILRRRFGGSQPEKVRLGPLTLNVDTYQVAIQGRPLDLTFKEFELLRFLASRPGRVATRATLLREVWGYDFYGGTRTVDVHVRRLRAKLGPAHEHLIETVRGVGYRAADL